MNIERLKMEACCFLFLFLEHFLLLLLINIYIFNLIIKLLGTLGLFQLYICVSFSSFRCS